MKVPMTSGPAMADIIVWNWNRNRMHWRAVLKDGTELRAVHQRLARQSRWWPAVHGLRVWRGTASFDTPDEAQRAAYAYWKSTEEESERQLSIEIVEYTTSKVEKKLGPYASVRLRDKADDGVNRNLDHNRFYTRFVR